jgi:hypothetical protein
LGDIHRIGGWKGLLKPLLQRPLQPALLGFLGRSPLFRFFSFRTTVSLGIAMGILLPG